MQRGRAGEIGEDDGDDLARDGRLGRTPPVGTARCGSLRAPFVAVAAPHSSQNFAAGRSSEPQLAQTRFSGAAQSSQNFAPWRFS